MSTKFFIVNNFVPVILFARRTQRDLSELCLRFSPPNQEKEATLFSQNMLFFPADGADKLSGNIGT
jgi:hypothetical protein